MRTTALSRQLDKLQAARPATIDLDLTSYRTDPVGFCHNVLGVHLWSKQVEIVQALVKHRRVLVKSANAIGKSFTAACLAIWFYLTHDPGICLVTAPTYRQVKDVTFKEIRRLYGNRPGLFDKLPRIEDSPDHYVHGFTTTDATAYQGIHGDNLFVIFEECVGVEAEFWEAANSILIGGNTYWLAVCNPTDSSSQAYLEEQSGRWHTIRVSAFDHPNIALELQGQSPLIPGAIRLSELERLLHDWTSPVNDVPLPTDIEFRGRWYRPGPIAEARLLGRYPSQGNYSIFAEADFDAADRDLDWHPTSDCVHVGCDVARFGDDMTCIHVRRGPVSLYHESYNGRDTVFTASRLKELAHQFGGDQARKIPIKIDDAGVGGGVVDQRDGYNFIPVNSVNRANSDDYPNVRSEMLFQLADRMREGRLSLSRLPQEQRQEIKRQALSITYKLDTKGRRVAEAKDAIKRRLRRSPDDLDALSLAYLPAGEVLTFTPPVPKKPRTMPF